MKRISCVAGAILLASFATIGCGTATEPFSKKTWTASAEDVRSIEVDVRDRPIYVTATDGGEVVMDYSENSKERYSIDDSNGTLHVVMTEDAKEWTDYVGTKPAETDREIRIQVPGDALDTLDVSTTNAAVRISPIEVRDSVSLASNGGDIVLDDLRAGQAIRLDVKNGNIVGTLAGSMRDYTISTTQKKGGSTLPESNAAGNVALDITANNGDIRLQFEDGEG